MEFIDAQDVRSELFKLPIGELRSMAMERMLPAEGLGQSQIIDLLLGHCAGCKGANNQPQPCIGCGQK